jgi:triphosphatase
LAMAPPRGAAPAHLARQQRPAEALRTVVAACRDQVIVNAAQVASGEWQAEHVHQLRVGLRRLRSGLRLLADEDDAEVLALSAPLAEPAAVLFRRLGAARDAAVMEGELALALKGALGALGMDEQLPVLRGTAAVESAAAVLREPAHQALLLELIALGLPAVPGGAQSAPSVPPKLPPSQRLRARLARRLDRWQRAVMQDAKDFAQLDDEGRHRLRKRIKRLRYAAELSADLFKPEHLRADLKPLRKVQQRLGELNDLAVGMHAFAAVRGQDPRAWFALGWLSARRDALLASSLPVLQALAGARRRWKR